MFAPVLAFRVFRDAPLIFCLLVLSVIISGLTFISLIVLDLRNSNSDNYVDIFSLLPQ